MKVAYINCVGYTHCENAILNTIGRELEFQIVFRACFNTVYDSHLSSLIQSKFCD